MYFHLDAELWHHNTNVVKIYNTTILPNITGLVDRYPQCPGVNKTIDLALRPTNYSGQLDLALRVLKGVEVDWNCASYCRDEPSPFRTFSYIKNGPVAHNCTSQINKWVHDGANEATALFWVFFSITIFSFAFVLAFVCRKHHELESPLLWHHNN